MGIYCVYGESVCLVYVFSVLKNKISCQEVWLALIKWLKIFELNWVNLLPKKRQMTEKDSLDFLNNIVDYGLLNKIIYDVRKVTKSHHTLGGSNKLRAYLFFIYGIKSKTNICGSEI